VGSGYTLTLGAATLTGNNTSYVLDVSSSTGAATVNVAGLNDGGNSYTFVKQNSGTLTLISSGSMVSGSHVNVTAARSALPAEAAPPRAPPPSRSAAARRSRDRAPAEGSARWPGPSRSTAAAF